MSQVMIIYLEFFTCMTDKPSDFLKVSCIAYIDGLVQKKRNSIANALELRLSCSNPSI